MLLNEIKSIQPSPAGLFERAEAGDREAQLIIEGIMSSLSAMGKKFVSGAKGKTKQFALALALAVPAMVPSLASAVDVDAAINMYADVEQMSDIEYLRHQSAVIKYIEKTYDGASKFQFRDGFRRVMNVDKDTYLERLKERIDSDLRGHSTIWKDESEMSLVLDTYWKVFRSSDSFDEADIDAFLNSSEDNQPGSKPFDPDAYMKKIQDKKQ